VTNNLSPPISNNGSQDPMDIDDITKWITETGQFAPGSTEHDRVKCEIMKIQYAGVAQALSSLLRRHTPYRPL
jgi:hypothetical protein